MPLPYDKLIVATAQDVQATTRTEIRKGPLNSNFLAGPERNSRLVGPQAPHSGPQWSPNVPLLFQLDDNLLCKVAIYLDPIWLFQLELTCTRMARFLRNRDTNFIWYRSLPGAIICMPEFFQKEEVISRRSANSPLEFDRQPYQNIMNTPQAPNHFVHSTARGNQSQDLMCLPPIDFVSRSTTLLHLIHTLSGREHIWTYLNGTGNSLAIRYGNSPPRLRTLAIGGPYQPHFDYRREILGYLAFTSRCHLCLEVPPPFGHQLAAPFAWQNFGGLSLCAHCTAKLGISHSDLSFVEGLCDHLEVVMIEQHRYPWSALRYHSLQTAAPMPIPGLHAGQQALAQPHMPQPNPVHWRATIDDVTRRRCGLDFRTLLAKEMYFAHILDATLTPTSAINVARRSVRQDIIRSAQDHWRRGIVPGVANAKVVAIRNAVVPVNSIGDFIFRPHNVSVAALFDPASIAFNWPVDAASLLRFTRDCTGTNRRSRAWKARKASEMLERVLNSPNDHGERMAQAIEQYHVQRLKNALSNAAIDAPIASVGVPVFFRSLQQKLFLVAGGGYTGGAVLSASGQVAARAVLGQLAEAAVSCRFCPAGPRGLEAVVRHIREYHSQVFFGTMDWEVVV